MKYIIAGGSGFIGQALCKRWLARGYELIIIGRSTEKIQRLFTNKVTAVTWNNLPTEFASICDGAAAIINLAGANIGNYFWTSKRRNEILLSRIKPTKQLAELCAQMGTKSPPLFNASAIGVYGLQATSPNLPPALDEKTPIDFTAYPDFLAEVGRRWEIAAKPAEDNGVRVVWMRFGIVLDAKGGVLPRLSLPVKFFIGGKIGSGLQPFTWISLTDLCQAIDFILALPEISGPINLVAPECVNQKKFVETLAKVLHRPAKITTPEYVLKFALGQMADELLLNGQNVYPSRLLQLGYQFTNPTLETALKKIYT